MVPNALSDGRLRSSTDNASMNEAESMRWFADSLTWTRHLPTAWRQAAEVANPGTIPQVPKAKTAHSAGCAFYFPVLDLLVHRLGWANPARGLLAWRAEGYPNSDPTLRTIHQWLGESLEVFIIWACRWYGEEMDSRLSQVCERWLDNPMEIHHPLYGGTDPFHLTGHLNAGESWALEGNGKLIVSEFSSLASFYSEVHAGWYKQLTNDLSTADSLISADVTVRPLGWVGNYRLDSHCMRPHACSTFVHAWGH